MDRRFRLPLAQDIFTAQPATPHRAQYYSVLVHALQAHGPCCSFRRWYRGHQLCCAGSCFASTTTTSVFVNMDERHVLGQYINYELVQFLCCSAFTLLPCMYQPGRLRSPQPAWLDHHCVDPPSTQEYNVTWLRLLPFYCPVCCNKTLLPSWYSVVISPHLEVGIASRLLRQHRNEPDIWTPATRIMLLNIIQQSSAMLVGHVLGCAAFELVCQDPEVKFNLKPHEVRLRSSPKKPTSATLPASSFTCYLLRLRAVHSVIGSMASRSCCGATLKVNDRW